MKYKGTTLILDNFRTKLKGFTVDVQDVVRSAILDGVDLEPYLESCRNNPYKLDQIRLSLKEKQTFDVTNLSGEMIYQIREFLRTKSFDTIEFNRQMKNNLSNEHISYLLDWLGSGISIRGLDISIIPKSLLEVFNTGLVSGVDMRKYNTGVIYESEVLSMLIKIEQNKQPVDKFLSGEWNKSVIHTFAIHSGNHLGTYSIVYEGVTPDDSYRWVNELLGIAGLAVSSGDVLKKLLTRDDIGIPIYSEDYIKVVFKAMTERVDVRPFLSYTNTSDLERAIERAKLDSSRTISGKFTKSGRLNRTEGIVN